MSEALIPGNGHPIAESAKGSFPACEHHVYCTYFDYRYLDRGLAMIRSLRQVDPGCEIVVLCFDRSCEQIVAAEENVRVLSLGTFEQGYPELGAVKASRSVYEYYCTLSGVLVAHVLGETSYGGIVTYVDADLLFYSSPAPLFAEFRGYSVGVIGHRYHWWSKRLEKFGIYNVGWVSFRKDDVGCRAAEWWRARCIEWCYLRLEGRRYADQKYLEQLFENFTSVVELKYPGANVAPWNLGRHTVTSQSSGDLRVDETHPLIFFHFSGLKEVTPGSFLAGHIGYLAPMSRTVRTCLYEPYVAQLRSIRAEVQMRATEPLNIVTGYSWASRSFFGLRAHFRRRVAQAAGHYIGEVQRTFALRSPRATRSRILAIGPMPPPVMGHSLAFKLIVEELRVRYDLQVVDVRKIASDSLTGRMIRLLQIFHIIWQVWRRSRTADAIYFNVSGSISGNLKDLALYLVAFDKLPQTIIHLHGGEGMRRVLNPASRIRRSVNRIFLARLHKVIVLGPRLRDIYAGLVPEERIAVVRNYADSALFASLDLIKEKFSHLRPLRILFLSNLITGKGHWELLAAFASLAPELRDALEIDFAGAFESRREERDFLNRIGKFPNARYHGVVLGEVRRDLFQRAHIFCLPTYYEHEGQPLSILEAYAAGCVVVTTDHSGIPDIFEAGRNGYRVEPRSAEAIRKALETAMTEQTMLYQVACRNRILADAYTEERFKAALLSLVGEVCVVGSDFSEGR